MSTPTEQPKLISRASWRSNDIFRRWLALRLKVAGFANADYRPAHRVAPEAHPRVSAITGIPGWSFAVSTTTRRDLSELMDRARGAAEVDGTDLYAGIYNRPGRDPDESYVILDTETLIKILEASHGS